ncbi:hypothetical protein DL767_007591 [Monosporascus sp. MG133]|nr:hypothetical protein DL767_007591 [Monosporascus sp. MG133]
MTINKVAAGICTEVHAEMQALLHDGHVLARNPVLLRREELICPWICKRDGPSDASYHQGRGFQPHQRTALVFLTMKTIEMGRNDDFHKLTKSPRLSGFVLPEQADLSEQPSKAAMPNDKQETDVEAQSYTTISRRPRLARWAIYSGV